MDWVTEIPPSGYNSYNAFLVIVERYSNTPIFVPCHEDENFMDKTLLLWNGVISYTGLLKSTICDRDPMFKYDLWTKLHRLFGTKLPFPTKYHPQAYGLA
ncbi:hypothetical protein O181_014705 [Austropuccinia psidii MF-1]|uniref:Integrase catalytic domain-containing protein n=1 Tax=Austropuccinia psidii MF-1 TaxID=1389203 RepID=A0A9Q3C2D4_9BASI|nr:hypothetical protein [Austropuccinia psidii MF-1]